MDLISSVLNTHHLHAEIFHNAKYCSAFHIDTSAEDSIPFHLVTEGECYLATEPSMPALKLGVGDLVLFPHVAQHHLSDTQTPQCEVNSAQSMSFAEGRGLIGTGLVCGYMKFEQAIPNPLLASLQGQIIIQAKDPRWKDSLGHILNVIVHESLQDGPGVQVTLNRLMDVVFVLIVRELLKDEQQPHGLLAALSDRVLSPVLNAMYQQPMKNWSVDTLAELAHLSKSVFSKRFKALLGESPLHYLAGLRMTKATTELTAGKRVAEVAFQLGYSSEAAFAKAYKKYTGYSPGSMSRR